ncbi:hypothetical protein ACA910_021816 [Epithemia clementina (nom. ined.)]
MSKTFGLFCLLSIGFTFLSVFQSLSIGAGVHQLQQQVNGVPEPPRGRDHHNHNKDKNTNQYAATGATWGGTLDQVDATGAGAGTAAADPSSPSYRPYFPSPTKPNSSGRQLSQEETNHSDNNEAETAPQNQQEQQQEKQLLPQQDNHDGKHQWHQQPSSTRTDPAGNRHNGGTPPIIDVLSVGCRLQHELQQAQQDTFGSHPSVRHFYRATEDDDTEQSCVATMNENRVWKLAKVCQQRPKPYPILDQLARHYFSPMTLVEKSNPVGWLCAQKRPFDGFRRMITKYQYANAMEHLPDYLLVVDDDTWVNLYNVVPFLTQTYPSQSAHVVAGCLMQTKAQVFNFTVAYGGYGFVFSKAALRNMLQPLRCPVLMMNDTVTDTNTSGSEPPLPPSDDDGDDYSNDYFTKLACWRLQQNGIGELPLFRDGMSIADLMHAYVFDQPFEQAKRWNAAGFCMHSDWAWSYFVNFYHIAQPVASSHYVKNNNNNNQVDDSSSSPLTPTPPEVLYDRLEGYNHSVVHTWSPNTYRSQYDNLQQCLNGIDLGLHPKSGSSTDGNAHCDETAHFCHRITPSHMRQLHAQSISQSSSSSSSSTSSSTSSLLQDISLSSSL